MNETRRRHYQRNREELLAAKRHYYQTHRDQILTKQKAKRIADPNYSHGAAIKKLYGLTRKEYEELLREQNHACAICLLPASLSKRRLAVDHDHVTGKVRGLLCTTCNRLLAAARDNPVLLRASIEYLRASMALGTGASDPVDE